MDYEDDWEEKGSGSHGWIKLIPLLAAVVLIVVILLVMVLLQRHDEEEMGSGESGSMISETVPDASDHQTESGTGEKNEASVESPVSVEAGNADDMAAADESDPQDPTAQEQGSQVDVARLLVSERVQEQQRVTIGIDVSRYQGTIDWSQVAETGIDFAMIRVGYRSSEEDREIYADTNARYNMQEAQAAGVQVGVYFFSTASTEEEARKKPCGWRNIYPSTRLRILWPLTARDTSGRAVCFMIWAKRSGQTLPLPLWRRFTGRGIPPCFMVPAMR